MPTTFAICDHCGSLLDPRDCCPDCDHDESCGCRDCWSGHLLEIEDAIEVMDLYLETVE